MKAIVLGIAIYTATLMAHAVQPNTQDAWIKEHAHGALHDVLGGLRFAAPTFVIVHGREHTLFGLGMAFNSTIALQRILENGVATGALQPVNPDLYEEVMRDAKSLKDMLRLTMLEAPSKSDESLKEDAEYRRKQGIELAKLIWEFIGKPESL